MNKNRRKQIGALIAALEDLQPGIDKLASEERECCENLPESLQNSESGWQMSAAADALEQAQSSFEEVLAQLHEAMQQ